MRQYADARIQDAIRNFVSEMLHESPAAQRILGLWMVRISNQLYPCSFTFPVQEYEEQNDTRGPFRQSRRIVSRVMLPDTVRRLRQI